MLSLFWFGLLLPFIENNLNQKKEEKKYTFNSLLQINQ